MRFAFKRKIIEPGHFSQDLLKDPKSFDVFLGGSALFSRLIVVEATGATH